MITIEDLHKRLERSFDTQIGISEEDLEIILSKVGSHQIYCFDNLIFKSKTSLLEEILKNNLDDNLMNIQGCLIYIEISKKNNILGLLKENMDTLIDYWTCEPDVIFVTNSADEIPAGCTNITVVITGISNKIANNSQKQSSKNG